jgi:hypothetical protein
MDYDYDYPPGIDENCQPANEAVSDELTCCEDRDVLVKLTQRIQKAGEMGRGCRITAEEAGLLRYYNLPCTSESTTIMGDP